MLKRKVMMVVAVAALLATGPVQALEGQAGLQLAEYGDFGSGFGLSGALDVTPQARVSGSYTAVDDLDVLALRGGYVMDMDEFEIELGGSYQFWDFEGAFEDDVYGLHGVVAYQLIDAFTVMGKLEFLAFDNFDDQTLVIGLGGDYAITPDFGVDLDVEAYTEDFLDETFIRLGGYYRF